MGMSVSANAADSQITILTVVAVLVPKDKTPVPRDAVVVGAPEFAHQRICIKA